MTTEQQPPQAGQNRSLIIAAMTLAAAVINLVREHWPF